MSLYAHELRAQQLSFWRSRESAIFVFVFPLLLYVLLGSVYGERIDGRPAADVLLAGLLAYGCANTAFAGLAITLVLRRESGLLKRIRSTPLPAATYVVALLSSVLVTFAVQTAALLVLGNVLFDASWPNRPGSLAVAILLGAAAFAGIGLGAAALIRSSEGASAVVNVILLPMAFLSGSFGPTRDFPDWLQAIADVLPLKHYLELVGGILLEGEAVWHDPGSIAVVVAWGLAGLVVAWRRFGWEPRER
jgi:ABC-2 type transport system permease protein